MNFYIMAPNTYFLMMYNPEYAEVVEDKDKIINRLHLKERMQQYKAKHRNEKQQEPIRYISSQTHRRESRRVKTQLWFNLASGASVS